MLCDGAACLDTKPPICTKTWDDERKCRGDRTTPFPGYFPFLRSHAFSDATI
jgi:hypothetical protein